MKTETKFKQAHEGVKWIMKKGDLFETPISSKKVRNDVTAHKYRNGVININGEKYIGYSMAEAMKMWRNKMKSS